MTKHFKPENTPSLIPYLIVQDADKSIEFYEKALGFKVRNTMKDENPVKPVT